MKNKEMEISVMGENMIRQGIFYFVCKQVCFSWVGGREGLEMGSEDEEKDRRQKERDSFLGEVWNWDVVWSF